MEWRDELLDVLREISGGVRDLVEEMRKRREDERSRRREDEEVNGVRKKERDAEGKEKWPKRNERNGGGEDVGMEERRVEANDGEKGRRRERRRSEEETGEKGGFEKRREEVR